MATYQLLEDKEKKASDKEKNSKDFGHDLEQQAQDLIRKANDLSKSVDISALEGGEAKETPKGTSALIGNNLALSNNMTNSTASL